MNRLIARICRRLLLGQFIGLALLVVADSGYYLAYYKSHVVALQKAVAHQGSEVGINLVIQWWSIGTGSLIIGLVLGLVIYSIKLNGRYLVPASLTNPLERRRAAELLGMIILGLLVYFIIIYASGFVVLLFLTPQF